MVRNLRNVSGGGPRSPSAFPAALLLVAALLFVAAPRLAADDTSQADAALAAGRYVEARDAYRALLDAADAGGTNPTVRAPLLRGLGTALLRLGEPFEALAFLEPLAKTGTAGDHLLYAEALVAHVRLSADAGPTGASFRLPYLADALAAAAKAEGEKPLDDRRLGVVGEAHDLAGRSDEAVAAWSAVPLATPPTAEQRWARERLAHLFYRLGRHKESAAAYESVGLVRGAAAAWGAAREGEKALALYAALLAESPDDATLLNDALATARYAGGQDRLDAVLAGLPATGERGVSILRARARLAEQKNDFAGALAHLNAARAASPAPSAGLATDLARVLVRGGSGGQAARDEAAAVLLQAWASTPAPGVRELMLAIAAQDFADAWRAWPDRRPLDRSMALQRALLKPGDEDATSWADLGNTLRLAGDTGAAVTALERAVTLAPGDAALLNDLGLAHAAAGKPAEALAAFRQAVADDGTLLAARQNLGRALWRQGDDTGAREQLAAAEDSARAAGAAWMLYRVLANRAWRTSHRPERR